MSFAEAVSQQVKLYHPNNPNPEFLFGVMMTDGKDDYSSEPMVNVFVLPRLVSLVGRIKRTNWMLGKARGPFPYKYRLSQQGILIIQISFIVRRGLIPVDLHVSI